MWMRGDKNKNNSMSLTTYKEKSVEPKQFCKLCQDW